MKRIVLAIVSAALLFAACSKDDDEQQQAAATQQGSEYVDANGHLVFYSTVGRASKVAMATSTQQCFTADDQVAIFESSGAGCIYEVDVDGSTKVSGSSTLYSTAKLVHLSGDDLTEGSEHYAVMPSSATWSSGSISVVQKATQQASAGSQDAEGCIHYAKTSSNTLAFNTLSAMFRLYVVGTNTTCDKIVLSATGIAGTATITLSTGAISAGNANSVTFQAASGDKFTANSIYYYGFLPGTYTTLTVTAYNGSTSISTVTYSGKTWNSGTVYNLYLKDSKLYKTSASLPVEGTLSGEFSVSATTKVKFSQGNLQYTTTGTHFVAGGGIDSGTWRFAEHQWDYVGSPALAGSNNNLSPNGTVSGSDNKNISSSYSGWIDLFGWGTSGWNSGATYYQPYCFSAPTEYYSPGGSATSNLTGSYANADWGVYNAISNGGSFPGKWRTLTYDEWFYLYEGRDDASERYGYATVNGVPGMVLLPDSWTLPDGVEFNAGDSEFWETTFDVTDWAKMEAAGAVFLPAAGDRQGKSVSSVGTSGHYWSTIVCNIHLAYGIAIDSGLFGEEFSARSFGLSVRLVR